MTAQTVNTPAARTTADQPTNPAEPTVLGTIRRYVQDRISALTTDPKAERRDPAIRGALAELRELDFLLTHRYDLAAWVADTIRGETGEYRTRSLDYSARQAADYRRMAAAQADPDTARLLDGAAAEWDLIRALAEGRWA